MNVHPLIENTAGLWQFQGNLLDSSPYGLHLITLATNHATPTPGGVEQYAAASSVLQGFMFNGGTKLYAPGVSAQMATCGDITVEYLMRMQPGATSGHVYLAYAGLPARLGGDGPGSLWTFAFDLLNQAMYVGQSLPRANFAGATAGGTGPNTWGIDGSVHHYAWRRQSGLATVFVDGLKYGPYAIPGGTPLGGEHMYIGGFEGASAGGIATTTVIGSLRVLGVARSDEDIADDAFYTLSPAVPTETGIVYDAVAAAQFATSLGQEPRT